MVRTQIMLTQEQFESIRRLAHGHRISFAEAVRRIVQKGLEVGLGPGPGKTGAAGLLELKGIGREGPKDLGKKHDRYLNKEFSR